MINSHRLKQIVTAYIVPSIALLMVSCSSSKDLTRSRAQQLIQNAPNFSRPATLKLDSEVIDVQMKAADEPEADLQRRADMNFYERYPVMAVLKQMGLVDTTVTTTTKPQPIDFTTPILPLWKIKVEARLTDQGRVLVAKDQAPSEQEALPLFRREVVEVTGITKLGQGTARAEYTWKAIPTTVGAAFDANGQLYKNLSAKDQKKLKRPAGLFGMQGSAVIDYTQIYKGVAGLQLFDDGWRVISL
jgi:hypothetical protein